ncbi:hypothetical protein WMY93_006437 [Mugilogobius chulae]|uniref:Ig-like domain-containing protein n=1 Tax=Mugilogobius chulae TaxID=88201 RepID=A0AAW0PMH5_9GOBI
MEGCVCLLFVICGVSAVGLRVSGSVVDVMLKPGDNTTLHCDCKCPLGVYTVWYRNCSHSNQPTLVLSTKRERDYTLDITNWIYPLPGYQFVKSFKSECYDLRITNITENDVGLYYCGTETNEIRAENKNGTNGNDVFKYGTRTIKILLSPESEVKPQECGVCWILLFSLCPP